MVAHSEKSLVNLRRSAVHPEWWWHDSPLLHDARQRRDDRHRPDNPCLKPLFRSFKLKFNVLPRLQEPESVVRNNHGIMDKDIASPLRVHDKPVPFFPVKPFDLAFSHTPLPSCMSFLKPCMQRKPTELPGTSEIPQTVESKPQNPGTAFWPVKRSPLKNALQIPSFSHIAYRFLAIHPAYRLISRHPGCSISSKINPSVMARASSPPRLPAAYHTCGIFTVHNWNSLNN